MKRILILLTTITQILLAQNFFEGAILAQMKDLERNVQYELKIFTNKKGDIATHLRGTYKVNQQTQTLEMKQIMNPDKVFMIYTKNGKQVYSEIASGDINKLLGPFEIKSVEDNSSMLGHKTKKITIINNDKEIIYIVAEDMRFPLSRYTDVFQDYIFAGLARNKIDNIPLKVTVKDKKSGDTLLEFSVIEIKSEGVSQEVFNLPAGVEKVSLY